MKIAILTLIGISFLIAALALALIPNSTSETPPVKKSIPALPSGYTIQRLGDKYRWVWPSGIATAAPCDNICEAINGAIFQDEWQRDVGGRRTEYHKQKQMEEAAYKSASWENIAKPEELCGEGK